MSTSGPRSGNRRTMFCANCDVTWRGLDSDVCWSCGDDVQVCEAPPTQVRLTPISADRLAG